MKRFLSFLVPVILLLTACQSQPASVSGETVSVPGGSYTNVSPAELKAMLQNKDFIFVNVHIPFEGNIPGTDLSIPYDQIGAPGAGEPFGDFALVFFATIIAQRGEFVRVALP
ncbi:MAG: hypothetical protein Fur0016_33210 [Anaerolineales bacterium]